MEESNGRKEFLCNISLIKALLPFCSVADRDLIQQWIKKLQEIDDGVCEAKARNEYSFYLLYNMQNGTLMTPFTKSPPPGKLKPLCKILPDFIYDEVQKQLGVSYCRLKKLLNTSNDNYEKPDLRCEPSEFQGEQPRPRKGVTAGFAVFSNYDDEN